jgi:sugar (pentulose or hexulose) kinase
VSSRAVAVGIDVGTTAVKGVAIDETGALLAVAEVGYPFATPRPGWVEQDPEEWWGATQSVLDQLLGRARRDRPLRTDAWAGRAGLC